MSMDDGVRALATRLGEDVGALQTSVAALNTYAGALPGTYFRASGTTRPSARTDIFFIFTGASDPSANMLAGDIWARR